MRQWEKDQQAQQKRSTETQETSTSTPAESDTPQNAEKHVTNATSVTKETEATHGQTGAAAEKTETAAVHVSPHGFGPYPEVPQDFINALGTPSILLYQKYGGGTPSPNHELMQRVMIKLWKQGRTDVQSAFMDGDRVRVHFKNRAYVKYSTYKTVDGKEVRYITSWRSGKSVSPPPPPQPGNQRPPGEEDISPGVELIDMDKEPGIDPYEFLGLN